MPNLPKIQKLFKVFGFLVGLAWRIYLI